MNRIRFVIGSYMLRFVLKYISYLGLIDMRRYLCLKNKNFGVFFEL